MSTKRSIFLVKHGEADEAFEVREEPRETLKPDRIRIEVEASGINFADVMARRGIYKPAPNPPGVLGYDVCGRVTEVGPEAKGFQEGDRVAAITLFGGYSSEVTTPWYAAIPIEEDTKAGIACALMTQGVTAYSAAWDLVSLWPGDRVLVHAAAGGVGTLITQIAKHKECEIWGTASKHKHEYAQSNGVDHPIDYRSKEFDEVIKEEYPEGLDVVFDNLGGSSFRKALKLLRPGGKIVAYGAANQNKGSDSGLWQSIKVAIGFGLYSPIPLIQKSQSIIGLNLLAMSKGRPDKMQKVMKATYALNQEGILSPYAEKTFPAEDCWKAHAFIEGRQSMGKVVLEW